jgi:AcrR family transcriptional regulator
MGKEKAAKGRGDGVNTREVLIDTALRVFNEVGYWGTDSNSLAREAGYSPGTFYRHFTDKRAIFLAAYEAWSERELEQLEERLTRARGEGRDAAGVFVDFLIAHHGRWRTFCASTRAVARGDARLERAIRDHRRAMLEQLMQLLGRRDLAGALVVLHAIDGVGHAIAIGEPKAMGVSAREISERVRGMIAGDRPLRASGVRR